MMSHQRSLLFAALAFICQLIFSDALAQQTQSKLAQQDQTVHIKTDLLEVRAVVTDRKGHAIDNLKKEDFELLEDGRPQNISFFSLEQIGAPRSTRLPSRNSEAPDPGGSGKPQPQKPARTIVIFVDNLHITPQNLQSVKAGLKRFVDEQVTDQDLVSLVMSTGSLGLLGQFTRERYILHYAIERISAVPREETLFKPSLAAGVERGQRDAIAAAISILRSEGGFVIGSPGGEDVDTRFLQSSATARAREILLTESYRRRVMLLTLKAVVERLAQMDGQRVIAFLSDGFTMMDQTGNVDAFDLQATTSSAVRSGVTIYSIDTKGLEPPAMFSASSPSLSPGTFVLVDRAVNESEKELRDGMNALASDTGGEMFFNSNDLNVGLKKALDANKTYYALAYYPPDQKDDKFHKIVVRVKGHPEYTVRAQRGYSISKLTEKQVESAEGPRARLFQAMAAPLPVTIIRVAAAADYLESEADEAQVTLQVHIDGDTLQYKTEGADHLLDVELAKVIFDVKGKPLANSIDSVRWSLSENLDLAKRYGYLYTERVLLKPGFYEFRIGVREPASGRIGTAMAWVEVPNISKGKLALSSINLSRRVMTAEKATGAVKASKFVGPKNALGIKFYRSGDLLVYRLIVYNAKKASEAMIKPAIRQEDQLIYEGEWQPLASRLIRSDKKGIEAGGQIALNKVQPGIYQLSILVKGSKSGTKSQQIIVFGVEP